MRRHRDGVGDASVYVLLLLVNEQRNWPGLLHGEGCWSKKGAMELQPETDARNFTQYATAMWQYAD